jgi:hypothetical protein
VSVRSFVPFDATMYGGGAILIGGGLMVQFAPSPRPGGTA